MAIKLTGKIKPKQKFHNTKTVKVPKIPHSGLATAPIRKNKPAIPASVAQAIGLSSDDVKTLSQDPSILSKLKNAIKNLVDKGNATEPEGNPDDGDANSEENPEDEEEVEAGYTSYVSSTDLDEEGNIVVNEVKQEDVKPLQLSMDSLQVVSKQEAKKSKEEAARKTPGRPGRPAKVVTAKPVETTDPSKDKVFEPLD